MSKNSTYNFNTDKESEALAETFVSRLRQITLSQTEAQEMRERLISYTNLHAVHEDVAAAPARPILSVYFSAYSRVLTASALIVLILVGGAGVSYAAYDTVPGQTLYGVKVAVIEPLQGALITTSAGQAAWQNQLTERRLTEASTLASQNKLSLTNQAYLAQQVSTHVALAQQEANTLSDSGSADVALAVRSSLDASLSAHATLLASVAPRLAAAGDATTSNAVVALLGTVEAQRTQVDMSRVATEVALGDISSVSNAPTTFAVSATPKQKHVQAIVSAQNSARIAEESTILIKNSALFRALPAVTSSASTTASSTQGTSSSTEDTLNRIKNAHSVITVPVQNPINQ